MAVRPYATLLVLNCFCLHETTMLVMPLKACPHSNFTLSFPKTHPLTNPSTRLLSNINTHRLHSYHGSSRIYPNSLSGLAKIDKVFSNLKQIQCYFSSNHLPDSIQTTYIAVIVDCKD